LDLANLLFEAGCTKIVTGKMLDEAGCPFCNQKSAGDSTLAFPQKELPVEVQLCGNTYIFVCGNCHKRAIAVQNLPPDNLVETLRSFVAEQYGGITDDRLMVVSMSRTMDSKTANTLHEGSE
jgi:hypothetical protein